jgi:hypothetical protein
LVETTAIPGSRIQFQAEMIVKVSNEPLTEQFQNAKPTNWKCQTRKYSITCWVTPQRLVNFGKILSSQELRKYTVRFSHRIILLDGPQLFIAF